MDGGLAILGFGLFLLSIAGLFAGSAFGLAWYMLAISLVAMGMAFSESKRLREVSLGIGGLLIAAAVVSFFMGVTWWMATGAFLFGIAFAVLWAEFRFPAFGHITPDQVPHHTHRRWHLHWPRRMHRV